MKGKNIIEQLHECENNVINCTHSWNRVFSSIFVDKENIKYPAYTNTYHNEMYTILISIHIKINCVFLFINGLDIFEFIKNNPFNF